MLVAFLVENWACFRDMQQFSMETVGDVADEFSFETGISKYPRLNRAAGIYGPNGSGKSQFVNALHFMRYFVLRSATHAIDNENIEVEPFRFDIDTIDKPIELEIVFVENGIAYEYGFAVDNKRVYFERLNVQSPGKPVQQWFRREFDRSTGKEKWEISDVLRGRKKIWQESTRPNALYISTAVLLNGKSLRPVFDWFLKLRIIRSSGISHRHTSKRLHNEPKLRARVLKLLRRADIAVSDIRIREERIDFDEDLPFLLTKSELSSSDALNEKIFIPEFGYPVSGSKMMAYLNLEQQSDGTQRLYKLSGLWLDVIDQKLTIVVDELDRSLHPNVTELLIGFINCNSGSRVQCSQLIATVHDTALLRNSFDQNQIWFTERNRDLSASISALSEYDVCHRESLQNGYLGGRYRGIPNVTAVEWFD